MSTLSPGGADLTRLALTAADAAPGLALLDIGCGEGDSALLAREEFGLTVSGVDLDPERAARAKERGADAQVMDAAALQFPSRSFDLVLMECVFSLLEKQEEAFHEAYCVLKPGGRLILTDLYRRHPDRMRWRREYREAMAQFRRPRNEGDCEAGEHLPSPYCQDGALVLDGLQLLLDELGYTTVHFEDRSRDLAAFAGQAILDYGSLDAWFQAGGGSVCSGISGPDTGYFLLVARKPDA